MIEWRESKVFEFMSYISGIFRFYVGGGYMDNKKIEKSCATCEFNFGNVCAGYGTRTDNGQETYGMPMKEAEKMFPTGCGDYGISLDAFVEQEKVNGR